MLLCFLFGSVNSGGDFLEDFISYVLVDGDVFSLVNLTSFFGFSLIVAAIVMIIHTFCSDRSYR